MEGSWAPCDTPVFALPLALDPVCLVMSMWGSSRVAGSARVSGAYWTKRTALGYLGRVNLAGVALRLLGRFWFHPGLLELMVTR